MTRPLSRRRKKNELTPALKLCFELDTNALAEFGVGRFDRREIETKLDALWKVHGAGFLPEFIEKHPTERPGAWWRAESPEPRPEAIWRDVSDNYAADRAVRRAKEIEILVRHGLLTAGERRFLEENPGLLLPLEYDPGSN